MGEEVKNNVSINLQSKKIKSFLNSNYIDLDQNRRDNVYSELQLFFNGSRNMNEFYQYLDNEGLLDGVNILTSRSRSFTPSDTVEKELREYIRNKIPEISKTVDQEKND